MTYEEFKDALYRWKLLQIDYESSIKSGYGHNQGLSEVILKIENEIFEGLKGGPKPRDIA